MRICRLLIFLFLAVPAAVAVEPALAIRAVAEHPGPSTQEYTRITTDGGQADKLYLEPEVLLGIAAVRSASAKFSNAAGWVIQVNFTGDGSEQFAAIAEKYLDQRLAFLINGKLRSAPVVRAVVKGSVEIAGDFTADEAGSLAADLNAAVAKAGAATPGTP